MRQVVAHEVQYETKDDEALPLYIDDESDLEEDSINYANKIEIPKKCFCLQCILKYFAIHDTKKKQYPHLYKLYKYIILLPCTETKCERDFLHLKIIKNARRSLLTEKNLQSLMIICLESDFFKNIELENVIDEIAYTSQKLAKKLLL